MTVDNFELIDRLLEFRSDDDFYLLQIIKRAKENDGMTSNNQVFKTVYIQRAGQLLELKDDLTRQAAMFNARIYINLNVKSFRKCTLQSLAETARRVENNDYHKPYRIFDSVAGASGCTGQKRWVVDIDWDGVPETEDRELYVSELEQYIDTLKPETEPSKVVARVPTRNGVHLIATPFDMGEFKQSVYRAIDVHKNNPTLLWYSDQTTV